MTDIINPSAVARDVLSRAALVHRFDPLAMMPAGIDPKVEATALALVAAEASEVDGDPGDTGATKTLWRLNPAARRSQLASLVVEGRLNDLLKRERPPRNDTFAQYLRAALDNTLKPDTVPEADRDRAVAAADFAAEALGPEKGSAARQAAYALRTLLSQQMEELRSAALLPGRLIGRKDEQEALDRFVAEGFVPESDRLPAPTNPALADIKPYLLTGTPGAGKSALVADLVRRRRGYQITEPTTGDWLPLVGSQLGSLALAAAKAIPALSAVIGLMPRPAPPQRTPVVLLDFDRAALALGDALEWATETSRQLGYGRPELAGKFSDMRAQVRQRQAILDPTGKSATAIFTAASDMKEGLASVLGAEGLLGDTLVLVLDTFEEVIVRSSFNDDGQIAGSLFGRVLTWADSLARLTFKEKPVFGAVRVLVSGRAPPSIDREHLARWFAGHRIVGDLDSKSAADFLRRKDVGNRFTGARADDAVAAFGGHPLTLVLLALYARNLKPEELAETIRDHKIGPMMGSEDATKVLYSRFLNRFHHDLTLNDGVTAQMVEAVAHPGLVLREITSDLLREVVCPACGFPDVAPAVAKGLFDRLRRQIWLVEDVPRRMAIRHRSDVRRLMLPMMVGDPDLVQPAKAGATGMRERALRVHRDAAAWYERPQNASSDGAYLEALYHRAFLPDRSLQEAIAARPAEDAAGICRRLAESAGADVQVMPVASRALLRFNSVGPLSMTAEEVAALPSDLQNKAAVERLELARRQTSTTPSEHGASSSSPGPNAVPADIAQPPAIDSWPGDSTPVQPAVAAPVSGTKEPHLLLEMVVDRGLAARVGYEFSSGGFDRAASIGWDAIAELSGFPDLSDPLRTSEEPVMHWFWQTALASLVSQTRPPDGQLEHYLRRFMASVGRGGRPNSAGLFFAAGTAVALRASKVTERPPILLPPELFIRSHTDLRILALHLLSTYRESANDPYVRVSLNRIRLFSKNVLKTSVEGIAQIQRFHEQAASGGMASKDMDAFAGSPDLSLSLTSRDFSDPSQREGITEILLGVTPELHDGAVRALIAADQASSGAMDAIVTSIAERAGLWPIDLRPDQISPRDHDRRAGLFAGVVMQADRCGLLVPLLNEAAERCAGEHLRRLARLAEGYEFALRAGIKRIGEGSIA